MNLRPADATPETTPAPQGAPASEVAATPSTPASTEGTPSGDTGSSTPASADNASPNSTGNEPSDLLSAVRAVLKPSEDDDPSGADTSGAPAPATGDSSTPTAGDTVAGGQTTEQDPTGDAASDEITEADLADIQKPSVRKRMERLLSQRHELRTEVESLRQPAELWQRHVEYLSSNGVRPEDAQLLYGVGTMLARGDYAGFLDAVLPYVEAAQQATGARLPADLQRKVDDGILTHEDAGEIARARAAAATAEQRVASVEGSRQQEQAQARATSVRAALVEWERGVATRDPDYAKKKDAVLRHSQALISERGYPRDANEAVAWAGEALTEVNRLFSVARPTPAATQPRPSSVQPATNARPEPKNMLEAVQQALGSGRAA